MPRSAWIAVPLLGLIALSACAPLPQQAPSPPTPEAVPAEPSEAAPLATPAAGPLSDQQFVDRALSAQAMQIGVGRLAHGKSPAPAIRTLGARLIADHTLERARLTALARHLRINPAPPADRPPPELLITAGAEFDREFGRVEGQALHELIALYEAAAAGGQDPRLKFYARETLPVLQHQLRQVQAGGERAAR